MATDDTLTVPGPGGEADTATPGSRRLPREQRRAQVLRAAAAAFRRGGFDGTSMEAVATAAGVTRLIVYRIFGSKDELYRAVLTSVTERLDAEFAGTEPDPAGGRAGTAGRLDDERPGVAPRVLRVARAEPDAFRLLWRHAAHEPAFAAEADAFREVVNRYAEALLHPYLHDRTFRRWAATSLGAHLYDGICAWLDDGDPARDAEFAERMAAGLRALVAAWS